MRSGRPRTRTWGPGIESKVELSAGGLVLGSALILGGLHVPVTIALGAIAISGCCWALRELKLPLRSLPLPAALAFALALFSVIQSVPLPSGIVRSISPHSAEIWNQAQSAVGASTAWASLSYDPGSSSVEALKWFTCGCVFLMAVTIGKRRGSRWAATLVFLVAALVAALTFAHGLSGAERVYGVYAPTFAPSRWHIGPLLNPNTLAGYLNLGAFCGLGLALSRRAIAPRWLLAAGVALLFGVSLLSGSRGGVILIPVGLVLLILLQRRQHRTAAPEERRREWLIVGAPVLGGLLLAFLGATRVTWQELAQHNLDKIQLIGWTRPVIADHPWVGVGRGAFESVFQQYRAGQDNLIFSHPENLVVQWLSEWGLIVGGLGLAGMAIALRPRALGVGQQTAATGIFIGALLVVLQNLVDLSLEVPAVQIALATILGVCWGSANSGTWRPERAAGVGRAALCIAGSGLLLLVLATVRGQHPVAMNRLELHSQLQTTNVRDPVALSDLRQNLTKAMLRHPGEPYFPRLRAVLALQVGDEPVLNWIDLALTLSPWSGRTHLLLANVLSRGGPLHQTLLELRLAATYDPGLANEVGKLAVALSQRPEVIERAAPPGPPGARVLFTAAESLKDPTQSETRYRLLEAALRRDPSFVQARRHLIEHLLPTCSEKDPCSALLGQQLDALQASAPSSSLALEYRARRLEKLGKLREAHDVLAAGCRNFAERSRCLALRLGYASRLRDVSLTTSAAKDTVTHGCESDRCAQALLDAGRALEACGELVAALSYFERATADRPDAQSLTAVGRVAMALGMYGRADAALARASRMRGSDPKVWAELQERRHRAWLKQLETPVPVAQ